MVSFPLSRNVDGWAGMFFFKFTENSDIGSLNSNSITIASSLESSAQHMKTSYAPWLLRLAVIIELLYAMSLLSLS